MEIYTLVAILKIAVTIMSIFFLLLLSIVLWNNKDGIQAFFWPNSWVVVEMLEMDNNCSVWLQKKSVDLKMKFNDGQYNLFHGMEDVNEKGEKIIKKQAPIYREGRLAKFFFIEGNEDPLDFRQNKITGNPQTNEQLLKVDVSRLFTSMDSLGKELWDRFGIFLVIGILILLVVILFMLSKGQQTPVPVTPAGG